MKILFAIMAVAVLTLTGCMTTGSGVTQSQFDSTCRRANAAVRAIQVLQDAGELSASTSVKFNKAKASITFVCAGPLPANPEDALVTAAQVYVVLAGIWRDNK